MHPRTLQTLVGEASSVCLGCVAIAQHLDARFVLPVSPESTSSAGGGAVKNRGARSRAGREGLRACAAHTIFFVLMLCMCGVHVCMCAGVHVCMCAGMRNATTGLKIAPAKSEVDNMKEQMGEMSGKIDKLERKFSSLEARMEARFSSLEARFSALEARLEQTTDKFTAMMEAMMDAITELRCVPRLRVIAGGASASCSSQARMAM